MLNIVHWEKQRFVSLPLMREGYAKKHVSGLSFFLFFVKSIIGFFGFQGRNNERLSYLYLT